MRSVRDPLLRRPVCAAGQPACPQVSRCAGLPGSDRKYPLLTGRSGTQRARTCLEDTLTSTRMPSFGSLANGFQEHPWFTHHHRCYLAFQRLATVRQARSSRVYPAVPGRWETACHAPGSLLAERFEYGVCEILRGAALRFQHIQHPAQP
jgi:hypothetical protein